MSSCPYTWFRDLFSNARPEEKSALTPADHLHVRVLKLGVETVRVSLPAKSARWLIELIPEDVVEKIRAEQIPLDAILEELKEQEVLYPRAIFKLEEPERIVEVWLL